MKPLIYIDEGEESFSNRRALSGDITASFSTALRFVYSSGYYQSEIFNSEYAVGLPTLYLFRCVAGLTNLYNQHGMAWCLITHLGKAISVWSSTEKGIVHAWIKL